MQIADIKEVYEAERQNIDVSFQSIYDQAVRMAAKVDVTPSQPRVSKRQRHRNNAPSGSIFEHYKVNTAIPFLDHIISELNGRFSCKSYYILHNNIICTILLQFDSTLCDLHDKHINNTAHIT